MKIIPYPESPESVMMFTTNAADYPKDIHVPFYTDSPRLPSRRLKKKKNRGGVNNIMKKSWPQRLRTPPSPRSLIEQRKRRRYKVAIVACGTFWSPQRRFIRMKGVKNVIAGYANGTYQYPTFHDVQDHTQAIWIEYDPTIVSYTEILQMWYENDDPWEVEDSPELRSAIFVTNQEQHEEAHDFLMSLMSTRRCLRRRNGGDYYDLLNGKGYHDDDRLYVDLEVATTFYPAEECQQDYLGKQLEEAKRQLTLYLDAKVPTGLFTIQE